MSIRFDDTNLLSRMVGKHGVSPAMVAGSQKRALAALSAFRKRFDNDEYGFPSLPDKADAIAEVEQYAASVAGSFDTVCVVGIGGSALGAWALDCAMRGPHPVQRAFSEKNPRLVILDNVDPSFVLDAVASMNPQKTLVAVIAKSGATAETVSAFLIVREWLERAIGARAKDRIVAVTSPDRGDLLTLAKSAGYRTLPLDNNVGGRFSVLSPVGLLPAALCGFDIRALCKGASEMTKLCWKPDLAKNIALRSAVMHWLVMTKLGKSIQVAFPYANRLWGTAFWFRQLWAESLGKKFDRKGKLVHTGQTPVAALGTTDQHSQVQLYREGPNDKVYSFWTVAKFDDPGVIPQANTGLPAMDYLGGQSLAKLLDVEYRATAAALTEAERPNCTYTLDRLDEWHIGAFLQMFEFQTAFAGELLGINAFDQEGVELGKQFTFALMGRKGYDEKKKRFLEYEKRRKSKS